jgi:type 1 glutamine amidotransferase
MLKRLLFLLLVAAAFVPAHADPLRVFIRAGKKTHGPGQHDHPRFLEEWSKLLSDRGAKVAGAMDWPNKEELQDTDLIIVFAPDPWDVTPEQKADITAYAQRGGSFVVLHDGICSRKEPDWVRSLVGGSWKYGTAKWFEGGLSFYFVNNDDPIVAGASNFDVDDELYYNLDMEADAKVLAATWTPDERAQKNGRAFPHIYNVAPQIWTYEKGRSRAFVDLLGHNYSTLELPHVRAVLLRGIAWAGRRPKINEFCSEQELDSLRYPAGGPSEPAVTLKRLEVAPEFTISLAAAEPVINKPIAIDWDPSGRLWLAETVEYPNGRRGIKPNAAGSEWKDHGGLVQKAGYQDRPARDRISYITHRGADGAADQKAVFYEGL